MTRAFRHVTVSRLLARGALLGGLLLAACDAALSGPPPPATPVPDLLRQELPAIRAAMARIQRFDLQRTSQPPQSATATVYETAVDLPARQARWTVAATAPVPAEETIRVDDVVYSRAPAAALWIRSPSPAAYALPQDLGDYFQHNGLLPPAGDAPQYVPAGEETVSGVLCRVYRNVAPTPDPSGFGLLYNAAYWVGIADHIVYRSAVDSGGEAGIGHESALLRVLDAPLGLTPPPAADQVTVTPTPTPLPTPVPVGWQMIPVPESAPGDRLAAVVARADDDVWAVGATSSGAGQSLVGHWDGQTWIRLPYTGPPGTQLAALAAPGPGELWAVGSYRGPHGEATLALHGDGRTWQQIPTGALDSPRMWNRLTGVAAVARDDVWAVGLRGAGGVSGVPFLVHGQGGAWQEVALPVPALQGPLAVSGRAPDDVWLVGTLRGTAGGQTLTLHWDGRAWQRVPSPNPGAGDNRLYAVSAGPGGVWAVGESADAAGRDQTLILHWDGQHWLQQASPSPGAQTNQLLAVTSRSPNDAWAGGTDGQTLVEHWDGRAWRVVPSPNSRPAGDLILGLALAPNGDLWAVGSGTVGSLALRYPPGRILPTPP